MPYRSLKLKIWSVEVATPSAAYASRTSQKERSHILTSSGSYTPSRGVVFRALDSRPGPCLVSDG